MATKMLTIDGVQVEMTDTYAQIVQRAIEKYDQSAEEAKKKVAALEAEMAAEKKKEGDSAVLLVTKDTQIKELEAKLKDSELTPDKLDAAIMDRVAVTEKAKTILGDKLVTKGKTVNDIRRQVVDAKVGDVAKGWSDEHVKVSFDTLAVGSKDTGQGVQDIAQVFSAPRVSVSAQDESNKAYENYCKDLESAWQKKPSAQAN
jgi:hypothetical protein